MSSFPSFDLGRWGSLHATLDYSAPPLP